MSLSSFSSIRSFVKRAGKITSSQKSAIQSLWPQFGVTLDDGALDFTQLFKRDAKNILEIGFGNGLSLAQMATQQSEDNFFGIEVHEPGVGSLLVQVKKAQLQNVRVSMDDAVMVLQQQIAAQSIDRIQIFFPDPWHKKRHHKRRLLQTSFVNDLVRILRPNGTLHIATDWEHYAQHIVELLVAHPHFVGQSGNSTDLVNYQLRPEYRPITKYETRGIKLGHGVWDMIFTKQSD